MQSCIFCGKTELLNTSMTVKPVAAAVEVWICDNCVDMATPSKVKEAFLKKQIEVDELIKKAASLGLHLTSDAVFQAPQIPAPQQVQPHQVQVQQVQQIQAHPQMVAAEGNRIMDGRTADKPLQTNIVDSAGMGSRPEYEIKSQTETSTDLKAGEKAEIGFVEGRGGAQIAIPVKRVGPAGTTEVHIVKTGGDRELQDRFKNFATKSKESERGLSMGQKYDVRFIRCGICNGTGQAMHKTCPKCSGIGEIQVSSF